ncbi:hypothetical protein ACS0TY_010113 [Phlomoides rotata]
MGPKPADTNTAGSHWFFNHAWEMLLKGMEFDTAHFITDVSGKYPRLWALKGAHPVTVNRWYKFGVLASIRTVAPGFREISELPDWVGNAVQEQSLVETRPLHQEKKSTEGLEPCGRKRKSYWPTKKNKAPCTYLATYRTKQPTEQRISRKS